MSLEGYEGAFFTFYREFRAAQMNWRSSSFVGFVSIEDFPLQTFSYVSNKNCFNWLGTFSVSVVNPLRDLFSSCVVSFTECKWIFSSSSVGSVSIKILFLQSFSLSFYEQPVFSIGSLKVLETLISVSLDESVLFLEEFRVSRSSLRP